MPIEGSKDKNLATEVGNLHLEYVEGVKNFAFFTPYDNSGAYCTPRMLQSMSQQMYGMGFQIKIGKPPIVVWNDTFRESEEYSSLTAEQIKTRVLDASKSMPSKGKYGHVETYIENFVLPRDFARALINMSMPRIVMVLWSSKHVLSAYAIEFYATPEKVETEFEGVYTTETTVGVNVPAFTNLYCNTVKQYRALCEEVLNRSWDDAVEVLLKMNEVESSILLDDDSQEEIILV